jgi:flagellar assembly protein FliH
MKISLPGPLRRVRSDDGRPLSSDELQAALEEARQQMQQELEEYVQGFTQTKQAFQAGLKQIDSLRQEIVIESEQKVLRLALDVARKVLMQEIRTERYEIDPIIRESLGHVPARQDVVVHLNPADHKRSEMVRENDSANGGKIRYVADPSIKPAECVLETDQGIVESVVEDHIEDIEQQLMGQTS